MWGADGFEQGEGEGGAVGVEVDVVAAEGEGHVEPLEEVDHRGVVRGDAGGAAVDGGGQLAAAVVSGRVAVDDAVFADVLAEENEPQDGQGDQHEGPGYRLDGLAVFEHNDHHRAQHDAEVDGRYGPEDDCQPHVQEQALRLSDKYTQRLSTGQEKTCFLRGLAGPDLMFVRQIVCKGEGKARADTLFRRPGRPHPDCAGRRPG